MSEKPSLYVVEKKEVIILVILFVLVTVLSFTMGVKYGESVGKKAAKEQVAAEEEAGGHGAEAIGGKLGDHGSPAAPAASHGSPEAAAHEEHAAPAPAVSEKPASRDAVEKNSDEYLLNALKESGIEPPGGKAPGDAKLPAEVKRVKSGSYVIQVGSHPTRSEAEAQVRQLAGKKVSAEILAPFKDRQGEWHRVVVGSFKTKRDAEKEAAQLKNRRAILSFFVWRLP
jgi:cell division protein FtsN